MEKVRSGILKYIVMISFLSYYGGATMFYHTHNIGDKSIVHSHLYFGGESSSPCHTHSSASFSLISTFLASLNFIAAAFALLSIFRKLIGIFGLYEKNRDSILRLSLIQSRAPPAVS